jgi:hypothetical protein
MRLVLAACLLASPALAYEPGYSVAMSMGGVIGSAEGCGLVLSEDGVASFIQQKVDPAELSFPGSLQSIVSIQKRNVAAMSGIELSAHCEAVKHTAAHFGLIE